MATTTDDAFLSVPNSMQLPQLAAKQYGHRHQLSSTYKGPSRYANSDLSNL
ncbi:hypothetical protein COCNU_01G008220 [Cocos nucifera]|uniref:Uncharacterized protein n=1 Tax=Cocos nucifera TaxID=13894 RepID=A0A8K0HV16_COCNU|nr:hypothetical protein COCNU_01G008220 [Cocos nucifera]